MAKHLRHRILRKKIDWQNMPSMSSGNVVLTETLNIKTYFDTERIQLFN